MASEMDGKTAERTELEQAIAADRAYLDGMKAGWNFAQDDDSKGFQSSQENRRRGISEARREVDPAEPEGKAGEAADWREIARVECEALQALKLRIHFIGWPAEAFWEPYEGSKVPDWRVEIAILEAALTCYKEAAGDE